MLKKKQPHGHDMVVRINETFGLGSESRRALVHINIIADYYMARARSCLPFQFCLHMYRVCSLPKYSINLSVSWPLTMNIISQLVSCL
jgi:hypothetical protein